ncbi:MAG: ATP-binding protein, partial [Desulfovibrio sp.]|nr:ATP-binding protein [Desulfovibrio sp.]
AQPQPQARPQAQASSDRPSAAGEPASGPGARPSRPAASGSSAPSQAPACQPRASQQPAGQQSGCQQPASEMPEGLASCAAQASAEARPRQRAVARPLLPQAPLSRPVTGSGLKLSQKLLRYTFDDFVVGESNRLAYAAAKDLCASGGFVDTLFLNSDAGLGKTHIVQSVAASVNAARGSQARVACLTADDFCSRFVSGSRTSTLAEFDAQLKALDFFMLDDVHFLQGKDKTQEFLLNLVKHLQDKGSKVVFTSSFQPRDLTMLDSQLVSMLLSGIRARMDLPTYEMRRELLRSKARVHQVILPEEVEHLLASRLTGDVRQLESCLRTLLLKMRVLKAPLTPEMCLDVLDEFAPALPMQSSFEDLLRIVAEGFGLSPEQLGSRVRRREIVNARNTLFYLARKHTDLTLEQIGGRLNKRHSTVLKGIAAVEQEMRRESTAGRQMQRVVSLIERSAGMATR